MSSLSTTSASRSPALMIRFSPAMIRPGFALAHLGRDCVAQPFGCRPDVRLGRAAVVERCCHRLLVRLLPQATPESARVVDSQEERRDAAPDYRDRESRQPTRKHESQALHRCEARRAERKEHRHGCTERSGKLECDSMQPRSSFGRGYLELGADEQRQLVRELAEELLRSLLRVNRLLERHGYRLVTLDSPCRRAVQVVIGAPMTSSGGRVIM